MINNFIQYFVEIDHKFGSNIEDYLQKYSFPAEGPVFIESNMIILFKIAFYSLFLILPLSLLKITLAENSFITILFVLSVTAFIASTFGVFLGFFQLLFI